MKAVFMGTPDIAAEVLKCLLTSEHEIIAVVTQPDRPKGRGKELAKSPVKLVAEEHNIPVLQPERVKAPEAVAELRALAPDIILVAAFGQIISKEILDMPKYGCINVHASLLPEYRGAAPIQWSIIDGKEKTGITIMRMDEGIDTGDMICKAEVPITPEETGGSLHDKLAAAGGPLLLSAIKQIEEGTAVYTPQNHEEHTYAKMLRKELGKLDFTSSAEKLERLIRGLNPWPSAYTYKDGKTIKFWNASVSYEKFEPCPCGTLVSVSNGMLWIMTGNGILVVNEVQPEGKRRMTTEEYLRGYPLTPGVVFGS
ncbi:MAG: methionyl-tRNA formyltransferase [Lachnospiraceae bacterium]|nr:methionyl-tRNA formyltransferase [Lachnospiraceae bacterium]